jgi:hypothetical protein
LFTNKRRKREASTSDTEQRIGELERMVGRLTMENELLKKAESWLSSIRKRNGQ